MTTHRMLIAGGLTALVAAGAVSSANAADLIIPTAPQDFSSLAVPVSIDDWTGLYVGTNLGGTTSNDFDESNTAWAGGLQAGYLHQSGHFVFGGELGLALTDGLYYELQTGAGLEQDWAIEATARAGVAIQNTLLYGTAGLSVAELTPAGATTSEADTHSGLILGAGIEQKLGDSWSLRAEYTQTNYWEVESTVDGATRTDDLTNHTVKVGVNYHF